MAGLTKRRMDGWMDEWGNEWMRRRMDEWTDGQVSAGWLAGVQKDGADEQMDG